MRKYLALLIILGAIEISLALYLTIWREHFWQSVSNKQGVDFIRQLVIFTVVAMSIGLTSGLSGYMISLSSIEWRKKLNKKAHKSQVKVENISQRIQEDCMSYPDLMLNLGWGSIKAVTYVVIFSISLMLTFNWWYVCILSIYCIIGSWLTNKIARPLIELNYQQQRMEATYRSKLSISNFQNCIEVMLGLAKRQKKLTYFQQFYGQLGVIVPLLLIAPAYFSSAMTLGLLMRFTSLSSTILDNMSYGINSFAMINKLVSCRRRLKEANII